DGIRDATVTGVQTCALPICRLRAAPPAEVGGVAVLAVGDYQAQQRTARGGAVTPIALPKSNVLAFELEGGSRIIARPSGTEPKRSEERRVGEECTCRTSTAR